MSGHEANILSNLAGRYMVGADVIGGHGFDGEIRIDYAFNNFGDFPDPVILAADVPDFSLQPVVGQFQQIGVEVGHVGDMQVGSLLLAAEDHDLPFIHSMVGQDVHRQVQALARGVAAHGGGADYGHY